MVKADSDSRFRIFSVPGGFAFIVASKKGLVRSGLPCRKKTTVRELIRAEFPGIAEDPALLPDLVDQLMSFYQGDDVQFRVKLDMSALTTFSAAVYRRLRLVRRGKTKTYKELAELVGNPKAARGVGAAMRRNPFPPIVP